MIIRSKSQICNVQSILVGEFILTTLNFVITSEIKAFKFTFQYSTVTYIHTQVVLITLQAEQQKSCFEKHGFTIIMNCVHYAIKIRIYVTRCVYGTVLQLCATIISVYTTPTSCYLGFESTF